MADFARWATAGLDNGQEGKFMAAYRENIKDAQGIALESSIVATALQRFMKDRKSWTGTASELLSELNNEVTPDQRRRKAWPKTPNFLANQLRRAEANLLSLGLQVTFSRGKTKRTVDLVWMTTSDDR